MSSDQSYSDPSYNQSIHTPILDLLPFRFACGFRKAFGSQWCKKKAWRKKRKHELGRQPANTNISSNKTVRRVRVHGSNVKWHALRLDTWNYSWGSEA